jgi:hypothetical protein
MVDIDKINKRYRSFLEFDKQVFDVYNEKGLRSIDEVTENGEPLTSIYNRVIDKKNRLRTFNSVEYQLDISLISGEIKYFTGLLYYLRPYINIPSNENNTYFQNTCDKRYLEYASLAHQNVYNFWDRIGDLLYVFFETGLEEDNVYFTTVLKNIPDDYNKSKNYLELKKIYNKHLKKIFSRRQQIVHYKMLGTKHYLGLALTYSDNEEAEKLEKEKKEYPAYFKEHSEFTFKGFLSALYLIDELPDKNKP